MLRKTLLGIALTLSVSTVRAQTQNNTLPTNDRVGIGNTTPAFPLDVSLTSRFRATIHAGDEYDPTVYGKGMQIVRPPDQGDNAFHLSFIRQGQTVAGMGFLRNSNVFAIQPSSSTLSTAGIFMSNNGMIGINHVSPEQPLDVNGDAYVRGNYLRLTPYSRLYSDAGNMAMFTNGGIVFSNYNNTQARAVIGTNGTFSLYNTVQNQVRIQLAPAGNSYINGPLAIGTTLPGDYQLAVKGVIGAQKVKVTQTGWADFVFADNYELPTIASVEKYIREHKHLPGIESAAVIEKEGIDLGEMHQKQMQKIEELTLYIIDLNKKLEAQQKQIDALLQR